jgi:polyhydroxyalkanoate synthesis regulator phasin
MKKSLQEAVQKAWAEAVSTLQGIEEQVGKRFRQALDHTHAEDAQRMLGDLGKKLQQNSEAVGQRIEESVKSVYERVRDPLLQELSSLRTRADELGRRIESQVHRKSGEKPEAGSKPPEGAG